MSAALHPGLRRTASRWEARCRQCGEWGEITTEQLHGHEPTSCPACHWFADVHWWESWSQAKYVSRQT